MVDTERRQCVDNGVNQRRRRADRPRFAGALDAEGIGPARDDIIGELDRRQVVGARQAVIGQRPGHELPCCGIEDGVFEHRLSDALRDPALNLAAQQ